MASAGIVGSTGLVGAHILSLLVAQPSVSSVLSLARRTPSTDSASKLNAVVDADTSKWAGHLSAAKPPVQIFFSGLGTTKGQAGSFEAQRKIDYDLNVELATAAKQAGATVYVLISSSATSLDSAFAYSRMKAEIEEAVKALGFEHTVLVKPGMIVGSRAESRPAEAVVRGIARGMGAISCGYLKDFWAQDADVIAKAAVSAGLRCLDGKAPEGKVWSLEGADIMRLGKTEWKNE
ncbi:MAG: Protein fmp52, mitochondrial [Trizodia sp. TS-e1964]|nr:MAG: Protein fmp52, mitochondrial [Trizodia sp. TS-e1964]